MEAIDPIELAKDTEICRNCKNVVVGKGNNGADIMFVGEAPGRKEDEIGEPFVGAAGKNLDKEYKSKIKYVGKRLKLGMRISIFGKITRNKAN